MPTPATIDDTQCEVLPMPCAQVRPWLNHSGMELDRGRPDLDSLNVVMGELDGLTDNEKMSAATLWAIVGAPLYSGGDLTTADPYGIALMTNPGVLSINADKITAIRIARVNVLGSEDQMHHHGQAEGDGWEQGQWQEQQQGQGQGQGHQLTPLQEVWLTDYRNGTYLLAYFNLNTTVARMCVDLLATTDKPITTNWRFYDVWESIGPPRETPMSAKQQQAQPLMPAVTRAAVEGLLAAAAGSEAQKEGRLTPTPIEAADVFINAPTTNTFGGGPSVGAYKNLCLSVPGHGAKLYKLVA